jgi:hypothetical protein
MTYHRAFYLNHIRISHSNPLRRRAAHRNLRRAYRRDTFRSIHRTPHEDARFRHAIPRAVRKVPFHERLREDAKHDAQIHGHAFIGASAPGSILARNDPPLVELQQIADGTFLLSPTASEIPDVTASSPSACYATFRDTTSDPVDSVHTSPSSASHDHDATQRFLTGETTTASTPCVDFASGEGEPWLQAQYADILVMSKAANAAKAARCRQPSVTMTMTMTMEPARAGETDAESVLSEDEIESQSSGSVWSFFRGLGLCGI